MKLVLSLKVPLNNVFIRRMQGMMGGAGGNHPQAKNATEEEDNEDQ